jgi:hypothetical protein
MSDKKLDGLTIDEKLSLIMDRLEALETLVREHIQDAKPVRQAINTRAERLAEQQAQVNDLLVRVDARMSEIMNQQSVSDVSIRQLWARLSEVEDVSSVRSRN